MITERLRQNEQICPDNSRKIEIIKTLSYNKIK